MTACGESGPQSLFLGDHIPVSSLTTNGPSSRCCLSQRSMAAKRVPPACAGAHQSSCGWSARPVRSNSSRHFLRSRKRCHVLVMTTWERTLPRPHSGRRRPAHGTAPRTSTPLARAATWRRTGQGRGRRQSRGKGAGACSVSGEISTLISQGLDAATSSRNRARALRRCHQKRYTSCD